MKYINQKCFLLHDLIIRETLYPWIYKEKLSHNYLRIKWWLKCNLRRIGSREISKYPWNEIKSWNWCLVPSEVRWREVFKMWNVRDVGCSGCGMFRMRNVWDVGCSGCGLFRMWNVWDVRCSGWGMFGMLNVGDVGCWKCGMLGI